MRAVAAASHQGKGMHPAIFVLGLLAAGWMALAMTFLTRQHDATSIGFAALFWIALVALVWTRWVRRPAGWLMRLAATVALAMLVSAVWTWTSRTDVFLDARCGCASAVAFWRLLFAWAGGVGLCRLLLGRALPRLLRPRTLREWLATLLLVAWTALCGWVLARNVSVEVLAASVRPLLLGLGLPLLVLAAIAGWIGHASRGWRRRRRQAKADYLALDAAARQRILSMVERAAARGPRLLLYRCEGEAGWQLQAPHVGGAALLPADVDWPAAADGDPAVLLLQLPLPEVLPAPWPSRVVTVWWLPSQREAVVASHARDAAVAEREQPVRTTTDWPLEVPRQGLRALVVPALTHDPAGADEDEDGQDEDICALLLARDAGLRRLMEAASTQPREVLARVISGDPDVDVVDACTSVLVGGAPQLIQGPHAARCDRCAAPLRFLVSSGDLAGGHAFGDSGIVYVYGCDAHPDQCRAFVDSH